MKGYDFKKETELLLRQDVTAEEAKFLKRNFGLTKRRTDKGVLLLASLFELAVKKGSVPAAKEILGLCGLEQSEENTVLEQMIQAMQEA
ncbi:MAG: hypothetical protein IJE10_09055 [Clostridia bacterium]|nr:hypothetical protein [Clostridia bacterium]